MKRLPPAPLIGLFLLVIGALPLSAQTTDLRYDTRVLGDRSLTIQLGPAFPLAFQTWAGQFGGTNLTLGGTLGIDLDFYLNDSLRLGAGLQGLVSSGPNSDTLFLVPITIRAIWEFRLYPFSFPVGLGAGFCFTNYESSTSFDPVLMPTAGAYWNMNSSWSFGLDVSPWIIFQDYLPGGTIPASDSRIGYFFNTTLGAIYHF
jgi:hypothetical protein